MVLLLLHFEPADVLDHVALDSVDFLVLFYVFHVFFVHIGDVLGVEHGRPTPRTSGVFGNSPKLLFAIFR